MNAMDGLTVVITNFRRARYLDRALKSLRAAGIRRVVVASSEPDEEVLDVIHQNSGGWISYDVIKTKDDVGCNSTWLMGAYRARTNRIIILHDDDVLCPEFGGAYETVLSPELDKGGCFVSWRANLLYDDGSMKSTEYWSGPTRSMPSTELTKLVGKKGELSLSPVVSVLYRPLVIAACKEAEQTLTHNDCLLRPGMLLGTEIVVYLRHIRAFPRWFYCDQVLSRYGSHAGSGTIEAETKKDLSYLVRGYDIARLQCRVPAPKLRSKIIFVYYDNPSNGEEEAERYAMARATWDYHFSQGDLIEVPVRAKDLTRTSLGLGDTREVPYIRDLFDAGCTVAAPEDVVVVCNSDILLSSTLFSRIIEGVIRGKGATCCQRRRVEPKLGRIYKDFTGCKTDGGFDVFAVTLSWWRTHREKMPDMLLGREAWDTCFRVLVEEIADGRGRLSTVSGQPEQWARSNAYTDHVAGHKNHYSNWIAERLTNQGQIHNRALARNFFRLRNNTQYVALLT